VAQIWDTAGQERFRSVTRSYYRGAAGALLVYDIASRETFTHSASWLRDARTLAGMDVSTVLIGNKLDLRLEREVPFLEAARFAQENDLMFLEASAMTGEGVDECFLKVARAVMSRIENGLVDPSTTAGIQIGTGTSGADNGKRSGGCIC
jgi:Ras-related protein Rab-4B